ncbi:3-oxoacyl-[acyl-carrier protein] reductase [Enterococcus sp. DIV2402]|uniref:3-oxoacyl-[acyl-carrier protein] reductase n=1 Tax=Candidatus Enterococcus lowellii TaxID=2230877 RepID=A0ABZ2SSB6_9ENTE|nr:3-oxoacyl-ACP reductase [Enterococcus sp. DIV2402]MBO0463915.1 3-oxoacyl-ACP reductase [Enterococcus sp. DIV2402]
MSEFKNKIVFVTGAASGIGYEQAKAFLEAGSLVFGVDIQHDFGNLSAHSHFKSFSGDLSQDEICQEAVSACRNSFGDVDILLNTAGILDDYQTIEETDLDLWQKVLATNLTSMFVITKEVLPQMLKKASGTIINMASVASFVGGGGGIAYTSAKHAVAGFTKQLALDYAGKGIHVNGLAPGAIQTPMNAADFAGDGAMAKWVAEETPMKRWAQPEEVAAVTLFLASEQARYMQGTILPIDGGWLLK